MFGHRWDQFTIPGMGPVFVTFLDALNPSNRRWPNRAVAIHMDDMGISIFDLPDRNIAGIGYVAPLDYMTEREVCLVRLGRWLSMDSVIAVMEAYHEQRFYEQHPSSAYYDEVVRMWQAVPTDGWELHRYGGWRLGLRRDIIYLAESAARSILVAEDGVTLFLTRVAEATDGKGLFISSENLSEDLLAGFMVWADAEESYRLHRMLRRWIFTFALRREQQED